MIVHVRTERARLRTRGDVFSAFRENPVEQKDGEEGATSLFSFIRGKRSRSRAHTHDVDTGENKRQKNEAAFPDHGRISD